ncbi:MAG TPA: hypothetical protein VFG11_07220, partial [Acidobacteriota bacterium]|nr:hypothetical protein [Acidobacteriota bacterium]
NANVLYIDTFDGHGPGMSTDGGRSWEFFPLPLPLHSHPNCSAGSIDASNLALSPFHPGQLFVSGTVSFICGPESDSEEFFLASSNGGKTWTVVEEAVYKFYFDQAYPDRVFATGAGGLKTLTRNGWQLVSSIQDVQQLISVPAQPQELFAFQFDLTSLHPHTRIIKSQDLGESWKELSIDQNGQIKVLAAMDDHSRGLLGGTAGAGLFRRDLTQGWRVDNKGFLESVISRVASASGQILFALSTGLNGRGDSFLYKTTDGGQNWRFINTQAVGSVSDFAVDPNDSNHILVSANGIFLSRDGGSKWQHSTLNQNPCCIGISALAFDPAHSNIAIMAGSNSSFVYRSTDGGATFTRFSPHLPSLGFEDVSRIIVDRNDSNVVYFVVPFFGFFKSTDGGQTVHAVNSGIAPPCAGCNSSPGIDLAPLAPRGAYLAITFQGKIYRTQNGGESWSQTGKTPFTQDVGRILSADGSGQHLYAIAGFYPHLYESLNSGKSWTDLTSQFGANSVVYDLTDPRNLPLFAGTNHGAFINGEATQTSR